ncbi:MAG TPA: response regulator transcription factor [Candidatus Binatia bacterium]|jgi:DNA-binding NarL/FixJ family response regulator|nr:response regulator transcription factor [Candidatus Binatia bacterium]
MKTVKILIADDHQILREGLKSLLEKQPGFAVVAEAEDGFSAIDGVKKHKPDIAILDIGMPDLNGIEVTRKIRSETAETRVIALSMHADRRFVMGILEAGAKGYLLKDSAFAELVTAVAAVAKGKTYLSPSIAETVVKSSLEKSDRGEQGSSVLLSGREREVLQLVAEGKSTKEIAFKLFVSAKTVETHRKQIMDKLNIRTVAGLTKYAIREGLTSLGN